MRAELKKIKNASKNNKYIVLFFCTVLMAFCCCGCRIRNLRVEMVPLGETVSSTANVKEGYLNYTINNVRYSDNVADLGINPADIRETDLAQYYYNGETLIDVGLAIDPSTGQLADHFLFVLMDVTVTNMNGVSYEGRDGTAFCIDGLKACDIQVPLKKQDCFCYWDYVYSSGTGDYDREEQETNGDNYFLLSAGESLTYQIGFIVGSANDDFSGICITDSGGSFYAEDPFYVSLELPREG